VGSKYLGYAEPDVLGVANFLPQRPAARAQPGVEFGEAAELQLVGLEPDPPTAVLHVLLDDALLPEATLQKSASNR
jgi:hypothetical protein